MQAGPAGCGQDGAVPADPTAWHSVHSTACGSPVRNSSAAAHLFYYLVKPEYFIATDKAPGRSLHAELGVNGSNSPASPLSHLRTGGGKEEQGGHCGAERMAQLCWQWQEGIVLTASWEHLGSRQGRSSSGFLCKYRAGNLPSYLLWYTETQTSPLSCCVSCPREETHDTAHKSCHTWQFSKEKTWYAKALEACRSVCSSVWQVNQNLPFSWERQLGTAYHFLMCILLQQQMI